MGNTTSEYWSIDGVSLQTYAQNITTWGGTKQGAPALRGSDIAIPHRPGAIWQPKVVDSQTIDFEGWVIGAYGDGVIGSQQLFRDNWRALKKLMFTPGRQVEITRRWYEMDGSTPIAMTAIGNGQLLGGLEPKMTGPRRAEWQAAIHMADPYFYGAEKSVVVAMNGTPQVVTIAGDDAARKIEVTLSATMTDAVLSVTSSRVDTAITYSSVASGSAVISVDAYTATENGVSTLSKIGHSGAVQWLALPVTTVSIALTGTGTGSATIKYREVWV